VKYADLTLPAIFGVPGYFLKGIERGLLARHLTAVQAEIFFIQLRRSGVGFRGASDAEKADLVAKWEELKSSIARH
jgi:hypothetical protein